MTGPLDGIRALVLTGVEPAPLPLTGFGARCAHFSACGAPRLSPSSHVSSPPVHALSTPLSRPVPLDDVLFSRGDR